MPDNLLSPSYGIPSSLLEDLTATTGDVLSGKTYLGSDGEVHSGTRPIVPMELVHPLINLEVMSLSMVFLRVITHLVQRLDFL